MNQRTGELGLDVAFQQFDGPAPGALIASYNGAALPPKSRVDGWARPTILGFESSTTRSYAGYDAGVADAEFSANVFDAWGYPNECGYWVCAADTPSTDQVFVPNITEYHRGFVTRMRQRGYIGPATKYGNPRAVEAACAGARGAGSIGLRWGVGTWGYGEGGGPNQPPATADCEFLQSGNTPGPLPATDLDWLYAPVNVFAAYNGPASGAPSGPVAQEDDVVHLVQYLGHPEPRPFFRVFEFGDKVYREQVTNDQAHAYVAAGMVPFKNGFPDIPMLDAPSFTQFVDVPAGGLPAAGTGGAGTVDVGIIATAAAKATVDLLATRVSS